MGIFRYVFFLLILAPFAVYLYFLCKRMLKTIFLKKKLSKKMVHRLSLLITFLLTILCTGMFTARYIMLMHFIVIAAIIEIINISIKRFKNKTWDFLYRSGVLALCITIGYMSYGYLNVYQIVDTNYDIVTVKKIDDLVICFISDLHFGTTIDIEVLEEYCQSISAKQVDLVVLGGDIVDERTTIKQLEDMSKALGSITSTYGTYFVYGNHDSFDGKYTDNNAVTKEDIEKYYRKNNIHILNDETVLIADDFYLIGRYDATFRKDGSRASLEELTKDINFDKYVILLDHQPIALESASKMGIDLELSGHTHGGQIFPLGYFNQLIGANELEYGEKIIDDFHAIVSSGMGGLAYPIRTVSKIEIVYITIQQASR